MKTFTPRDDGGRFESWDGRVEDAGSYSGQDAAVGILVMAAGVAIWEFGKWAWDKITDSE